MGRMIKIITAITTMMRKKLLEMIVALKIKLLIVKIVMMSLLSQLLNKNSISPKDSKTTLQEVRIANRPRRNE